jgi:F1F0 ATPase subunit 2
MTAFWLALFALLGAGAGAVHFAAIARDADLLVRGGSPLAAVGLRLGRMVLTVAVLLLATINGWPMLLAALAGLMAMRQVMIRQLRMPR